MSFCLFSTLPGPHARYCAVLLVRMGLARAWHGHAGAHPCGRGATRRCLAYQPRRSRMGHPQANAPVSSHGNSWFRSTLRSARSDCFMNNQLARFASGPIAQKFSYNCAMPTPILTTKLYLPPPRPDAVLRSRLIARLNAGLHHKLALICAPAGFGKTTLLSAWLADCGRPVAWLSLDEGDSDPTRFLLYLVAALRTIAPTIGEGLPAVLQSPQPPPPEAILTTLLNDIATVPDH